MMAIHYIDLYWIVMPFFRTKSFGLSWMDFTMPIGLIGLWLWYFLTQLEQRPQPQGLNATFDVNFRDAPLVPVLNTLAQYAGLNLVIPPDINGTVTVDLKSVTLLQALEAILPARGLQYRIEDGMLRVERIQLESRSFKFDYITTQRSSTRSTSRAPMARGSSPSCPA